MAFAQGSKCGREPARPPAIFKNVSRSTEGWGLSSGFESTSVFSAGNTRRGPMDRTTARGAAPQSPAAALPSVATDAHWRPTAGRLVLSSVGEDLGQGQEGRCSAPWVKAGCRRTHWLLSLVIFSC